MGLPPWLMPRLRPTLTPTTGTTATALPPTTPTPPGQESVDTHSLPLATDAADTDTSDIISASDPLTLMPTPMATTVVDTADSDTMVMDMVILDTDTVLPTMLALSLTPTDPSKDFMAANVVMLTPTPMLMLTMDMDMVAIRIWTWLLRSWVRIRTWLLRTRTSWILRPRIRICSLGLSHSEDVPFLKRGHLVQWMYTFNQWFSSKKDSYHTLITSLHQEFTREKFKS